MAPGTGGTLEEAQAPPLGVCPQHSGVVATLNAVHYAVKAIDAKLSAVVARPPVWATIAISVLTALLGGAVGVACILAKNGGP